MKNIKLHEYILGFLFISAIYLLIIHFTLGIKTIYDSFGFLGIFLPIIFLYVFGLIGFYLFKRRRNKFSYRFR